MTEVNNQVIVSGQSQMLVYRMPTEDELRPFVEDAPLPGSIRDTSLAPYTTQPPNNET
jgi:hypothetical protein